MPRSNKENTGKSNKKPKNWERSTKEILPEHKATTGSYVRMKFGPGFELQEFVKKNRK